MPARPLYGLLLSLLLLPGCTAEPSATDADLHPARFTVAPPGDAFGDYWYQGLAELTSYDLEQARYGELREGSAVLIYVTEDFSRRKHVKLDDPGSAGDDKVNVLKLNFTKEFTTGIYPYSMMASIFSPVDGRQGARTLKVTTTAQEWCGHTFTQLNRTRRGYRLQQFSYFESEGDLDTTLDDAPLEDELWTTIRLNPEALPTGRLLLIPGALYQRLSHTAWDAYEAEARLETTEDAELMRYTLHYPALERTLSIRFNKTFPHVIEGWEETRPSGSGPDAPRLTTRATKKERMMLDYWTKNGNDDLALRAELGLK